MSFAAIDDAPVTGFHRKLTAACSGGPLLDGYLLGIVGIALTGITTELHISTTTSAVIGVAALVGMFFGGLVFGPITDRIGRKPMYTVDLLVLLLASLLSVFVTSAWQLIVLRFAIGVAIAADYPIATALLTEWLPRKRRAGLFASVIIIWYVGTALAYLVGYLITAVVGDGGWRWMLGSAAVLAGVIFLLRLGTPESPRWLVGAGRSEQAREVIERAVGVRVSAADLADVPRDGERGSLLELFRGGHLRRMAFVVVFFTCAIIPLFALLTFGPQLLGAFGLGTGNAANLGTALINLVFAIGCLPAMKLLETVGRRRTIIWSFGLMVLPLLALGVWAHAPAPFAVACFCLYALFSGGPGILEWGYPNELFPTRVRAAALGVAIALTRFGAAVGTFLVPLALTSLGTSATLSLGAGITFIGFLACLAWAEETRHLSLEDIDVRAGQPTMVAAAPGDV
ncbi:MFS transporter [Kutzneria buriramensis]|uniref:Putative MFS transporter n=1 Tax=Kutzneria buriramensis TaxID=1045776 RepID=A0A3E0H1A9_9PSEU|nr:MFS transporter [Kutzneria buriramensis]REH35616.1 putative MFS transporter [Kutzneria buriramensis]